MEKDKVIGTITKLLELSKNNPSEEEAQSALLKAQELIAKHNVHVESSDAEVITYSQEICNSKWNMGFRKPLAKVISDNFRCRYYLYNGSIVFLGRSYDAKIAKDAFEYAYEYAMKEANKMYNKAYSMGLETKGVFNSYTLGFIRGMSEKFGEQCTALKIVTPQDVHDKFEQMTKDWKTAKGGMEISNLNRSVYEEGRRDGKSAVNGRQIEG